MKLNEEQKESLKKFISVTRENVENNLGYFCTDVARECYMIISQKMAELIEDNIFENQPEQFVNTVLTICAMISSHHIKRLADCGFAKRDVIIKEFNAKIINSLVFQDIRENNPEIFKDH